MHARVEWNLLILLELAFSLQAKAVILLDVSTTVCTTEYSLMEFNFYWIRECDDCVQLTPYSVCWQFLNYERTVGKSWDLNNEVEMYNRSMILPFDYSSESLLEHQDSTV